jgi:putative endonuclease
LDEHNSLKYSDAFTSKGIPWELYYAIEDLSSGEAYWIEKKIKSNKSSKYIKNLKNYPEITQKLIETAKSLVQPR